MPRVLWGLSSSRDSSETCPGPRPVPICENVSRNPSIHLDVNGFVQSCMNHEKLETFMYFFWDSFILLRERNRRIQISEGPHALPWLYYKTPRGKIRWRWQDLSWGPRRGAIKTLTAVAQAIEPLHALFDKTTTLPAGGKVMTVGRAAWDGLILITSKPLPFIFFSSLSLSTSHIMQIHTQASQTPRYNSACHHTSTCASSKHAGARHFSWRAWRSKLALVAELVSQLPSSWHCRTVASGFVIKIMWGPSFLVALGTATRISFGQAGQNFNGIAARSSQFPRIVCQRKNTVYPYNYLIIFECFLQIFQ
jgi:hypothetical protein